MDALDLREAVGLDGQALCAIAEPRVRRADADRRSLAALRGLPPVGLHRVVEVVLHSVVASEGHPFPAHAAASLDLAPLGVAAHVWPLSSLVAPHRRTSRILRFGLRHLGGRDVPRAIDRRLEGTLVCLAGTST